MQKHLPEVFEFIKETGDFEPMNTDDESSDDPNANELEYENEPPMRGPTLSSPPQSRPLTGAATAQTSAALRGALSPRAGNMQYPSTSPSAFQSLSPGRSAQPSHSPALGVMRSPPGRDSAQSATEAMRQFGLGAAPQPPQKEI